MTGSGPKKADAVRPRPADADAGKGKPGSESEAPHSGFYSRDKADGSSPGLRIQKDQARLLTDLIAWSITILIMNPCFVKLKGPRRDVG